MKTRLGELCNKYSDEVLKILAKHKVHKHDDIPDVEDKREVEMLNLFIEDLKKQIEITSKTFLGVTHDNGNRPFVVHMDSAKRTFIYKQVDYLVLDVKKIFKGQLNSSCLLQLTKRKKGYNYYFVGIETFSFKTSEKIINYVAPIGNSNVPYPYAESKNYYYMLLDRVYFKKSNLDIDMENSDYDLYNYYWKNEELLKPKKLDKLKIIEERLR